MNTISGQIEQEIKDFENASLACNPSYAPTSKNIIELIDLYWVSKFKDGDTDSTGFKKAFYNIVENPTQVAAKMTDIDTKDIKIIAEEGQSYYPAWLLGKELKVWMKDNKNKDNETFGQFLNSCVYNYPKYGHLLVKKAKNSVYLVPLQNLIYEADAENFMKSGFLIEVHEFTPEDLRKTGWDNIEEVIEKYEKKGKIIVFERQGTVDISKDYNYFIIPKGGERKDILFYDKKDREDLYREVKWDKVSGRALGRGQVEKLFENQIAKNQNENLLRAGLRWSSKHLFQTRDETIASNLMTDVENGDLMIVNSEITPIAMEERNLAAYRDADAKWDKNTADRGFTHEPMSGQRPPSGTPLGTSILQTRMAGMFYELKQEDLGMFLKNIIFDWLLPDFKKTKTGEHKIMLGEFDEGELDKLRGLILGNKLKNSLIDFVNRNKHIPTPSERQILKGILLKQIKGQKDINIPKGYYDNLKYKIDVVITGEQIDIASRMTTLQTLFQIIGSNPSVLQDKRTRRILYKLVDLAGFNPMDLGFEEGGEELEEIMPQIAERGGSIARTPTPMPTPAETSVATTL